MFKNKFITSDKVELYFKEYRGEFIPKAIFLIAHGMAEHSERYNDFMKFLLDNRFYAYIYDHRGHGKTANTIDKIGYIGKNGWNRLVDDYNEIYNYLREKYPNKKIICLGHSMGSYVVRSFMYRYPKENIYILSGTFYGGDLKPIMLKLLSRSIKKSKGEYYRSKFLRKLTFTNFNKCIKNPKTEFDWLTNDEEIVEKYVSDTFCGGTFTSSFFAEFFKGVEFVSMDVNMRKVNSKSKVLLISGKDDPVGEFSNGVYKVYEDYKNIANINIDIKIFENMRHEVLNEIDKSNVYDYILFWVNKFL